MTTKWTHKAAGLALAGMIGFGNTAAQANYNELLNTLEKNGTLTAEQAADLKGKAPKYNVLPANKAVKNLKVRGRVQVQAGYVDADNDEGSDDFSTFEVRRARIGINGTFFDKFRAEVEANIVPDSDFSVRSAWIQWREHKAAYIKAGYDKPRTSLEENTSSSEILTVERSVINGLVAAPGEMTGLALDGEAGILYYGAGIYTDELNRNSGGTEAEYMYNGLLGLKLDELVGGDNKLRFQATYQKSDDPDGKVGAKFDDVVVAGGHLVSGPFDLRAEYFLGDKDGMETSGFYVMPSVYLTEKVQAVVRFEQAEADKKRGIKAPSRYTRDVESLKVRETLDGAGDVVSKFDPQAGDEYQSIYVGLNYYFANHAHKMMFGVELAELDGTDAGKLESTTVYTAWRMLF